MDVRAIAMIVAGLVMVGAVLMTLSIMKQSDSAVTVRVRAALRERLASLRFGRMLGRRGIAVETYLDATPADVAKTQMNVCEGCAAVARCDTVLESEGALGDLSFCANAPALDALPLREEAVAANDDAPARRCAG